MRLLPRSLFGRLLVTALAALAVALLVAGFAIGHILGRFVMHGLDERLDAQLAVVARAVRPDGSLDRGRAIDVPPFDEPGSGWAWQVRAPGGMLRSASLGTGTLDLPPPPAPPRVRDGPDAERHGGGGIRPLDTMDVHGRALIVPTARGDAEIVAVGPREIVERPLRAALVPMLASLLLLALLLAGAILIQLRLGLRPIARLERMLTAVREGRREHVEAIEPSELLPLVGELNALIDANVAALARARGHVANLAHGLKTPLAALRLELAARDRAECRAERGAEDGGGDRLVRQLDRIDAQVRHHLGRARLASGAVTGAPPVPLGHHVADLAGALAQIHAERGIAAELDVPAELAVRCDPQDLDELLGNLMDNGWRWARSAIRVSARTEGRLVAIAICDDGPGIAPDQLARLLRPGQRLDEDGAGHGFGLPIARELAELHGGSLAIANRPEGGLAVRVTLPAQVAAGA